MRTHSFGKILRRAGLLLALGTSVVTAQSTQGSIAVHVTDASGGRAIDQAQVVVLGTNVGGMTNAEGRFTIRNVPAGPQTVRVLRVGYGEQKKAITVTAGQTTNVDVQLSELALTLAPVVTTATGEQRRVEIGNATANIGASKVVESAPVGNVGDLLNSRASNVIVTTGTQTGTGSRIRVRGVNSISLNNEPIWVIDGVRMTSSNESFTTITGNGAGNALGANTGGNNASRTGDLNPDEIESIEIVKGPSAATLYGTDAANGVIVVTTKRGKAGKAQWSLYGEGGIIRDRNEYPTAYTLFGTRTDGVSPTAPSFCNLQRVASGLCTTDSIGALNIFKEKDLTPLGTGNRRQFGAQVSGGSDAVRYFVSGENEGELGVLQLPEFERDRFKATNTPIRDWTERPNQMIRNSLRVNLNSAINSKLDLSAQTNFINLGQRYTLESNSTAGLGSQVFGGPGYRGNGNVSGLNTPLNGYRAWTPGYMWQEKTEQDISRFIWSGKADWRPTSWWQNRMTVGQDFTDRSDENLLYRGDGPPLTALTRLGSRGVNRVNLNNITVDLGSTATFTPRAWLNLKTTAGAQYVNFSSKAAATGSTQLAPGAQTVNAGAVQAVNEATILTKTVGIFVEQSAALNDRLFLTAAVRSDQNSAFGTNFQRVFYPKFSASWLLSDESFWKAPSWMNSLRLRMAYGQSGVQPGPNDAQLYYSASTTNINNADVPAVTFASLGNTDLKPERSSEIEGGFESQLLNGRLTLDVTYYNKKTEDALISRIIAPSYGIVTRQLSNLGAVRNAGWEFQVNAVPIEKRAFVWDIALASSFNSNEVLDLGPTPPQINTATQVRVGYPIGGLWAQPITGWKDKDGNGILSYSADTSKNEVFIGPNVVFRGYSTPRYLSTLTNGFSFLNRKLRLQSMWDYRGGNRWFNDTERIRCQRPNCAGRNNPKAPFELQAANIARLENPVATLDGYFMEGAFVRLRELSLQYTLSNTWSQRLFRSRSASFSASGRNLLLITNYLGTDPETGFNLTSGTDAPADFQTLAPPSYFVFRINLGY